MFTKIKMPAFFSKTCLLVCVLSLLPACSIKPWVKPYERANLADKVMSHDGLAINSNYMHHVRQAREGARGAEGGGGGGCGCN